MSVYAERKAAVAAIMTTIRAAAAADPDPDQFLADLQVEIETIPGAMVSFVTRDSKWLTDYGYIEKDAGVDEETMQQVLFSASVDFDEGSSSQDDVTVIVMEEIQKRGLAPEDEDVSDDEDDQE